MPDPRDRPQCPSKGCPVRFRGGPDRLCPEHQKDAMDGAGFADLAKAAGITRLLDAPGGVQPGARNALSDQGQ